WGTVVCIEPSPTEAGTAYVVVDAHKNDDRKPYLWVTRDFGKTWKSLTSKIPDDGYLSVVRVDPAKKGMLYAGTERGVIYSTDDGATWERLRLNFPNVRVTDIKVKDDDLVVGTNGRSIWILDDLTPLRQLADTKDKNAHLFPVRPALRIRPGGRISEKATRGTFDNPPVGAIVHYYLKARPKGDITLTVLDAKDQVVRTL